MLTMRDRRNKVTLPNAAVTDLTGAEVYAFGVTGLEASDAGVVDFGMST